MDIRIHTEHSSIFCDTADEAAAIVEALERRGIRGPGGSSDEEPAEEEAPRRRRARRARAPKVAAEPSRGGRKFSPVAIALYEVLGTDSNPDLQAFAKGHRVSLASVRGIIQRGITRGRLRALAGGGWKVLA